MPTTSAVHSADGSLIPYTTVGNGPLLVLIEPPLHWRGRSAYSDLVPLLAPHFRVLTYDRRGRGESTEAGPYAPDLEVQDLHALIVASGAPAQVYGYSGGALLALRASAKGLPIRRLAVLEPPLQDDAEQPDPLTGELAELIASERRAAAIEHFHASIGVPAEFIQQMPASPAWPDMLTAAHTLVYDCMISDATTPALLAEVPAPTMVLDSMGSTVGLTGWAASVAAHLPDAGHRSLPGQWHTVPAEILADALTEFFIPPSTPQ